MAAIPFYIIVGDGQLNGPSGVGLIPQPGFTGTYWTNFRNKPLLMQTVPTSGSAYAPWWDGTAGTQLISNAATNSTVTVTTTPWTTNSEVGKYVTVDGGIGAPVGGVAQRKLITSNTTNQLTISGTWTTNPTASAIHVNDGQWVTYDHVRGADNPLKVNTGYEGDNWYANQNGGFGFTVSLMQLLKSYHPGGFKVFKYAALGATDDWASGGAQMTAMSAELAEAVAAMGADTPDYRGVIYWNATDISEENLAYVANATSFCSAIRTLMADASAEVPIWFVNNSSEFLQESAVTTIGALTDVPFAQVIRQANVALRATIDNFHLLDMEGAGFSADSVVTYATEDTDPQNYGTEDHLVIGEKAYNAIVRYYADIPSTESGSLPVVVMLGDSQGVGFMPPQYAILGGQERMLGPTGTVRDGEWIWNDVEQAWEPYDVTANPNTLGAPTSLYYGPEAAMLAQLKERFPDGVAVFKMAQGGASLTTEGVVAGALDTFDPAAGTLWDELGTAWNAAKLAMVRDLGLLPDVVGGVYLLTDNDAFTLTAAQAVASKLELFNTQFRERFQSRTTGTDLPIVSHLIVQHIEQGGPSNHGTSAAREAIRATLQARAVSDSMFAVTSDEGLDLLRDDQIHYSGWSQDTLGIRLAQKLVELIDGEGETATATGDTPSGSATFVVEDGSGLTTSNSYCSTTAADTYHAAQGNPSDWSDADLLTKQDALRRATESLDLAFGARWNGFRSTSEQALDWPRAWCIDSAGNDISSDTIPTRLAVATARAALLIVQGYTIVPATQTTADIASESNSVGEVSRSVTYRGGKPATTQFPLIERMIVTAGLASSGAGWGVASA